MEATKTSWAVPDLVAETGFSDRAVRRALEEVFGSLDALKPGGRDIVLDAAQHRAFARAAREGPRTMNGGRLEHDG